MRRLRTGDLHCKFAFVFEDFWDATAANVSKLLSEEFARGVKHEIDGLIFQPVPDVRVYALLMHTLSGVLLQPYLSGRTDRVLKWKPPALQTVDFKLRIQKQPPRPG